MNSALFELQNANIKLEADIEHEKELEQARTDFFSVVSHLTHFTGGSSPGAAKLAGVDFGYISYRKSYVGMEVNVGSAIRSPG